MSNVPPSGDPANLDTLVGAYREIFDKLIKNTDGMLPAKVLAYRPGPPARVEVQPMIAMVTTARTTLSRPGVASIPVLQLGGGGYMLRFPIQPGDLGWIIANDRDISLFTQNYSESAPNTARIKKFSDAIFIPDTMRNYTVDSADANNFVIQSIDGATKITLSPNTVKVIAENVIVDGENVQLGGASGGVGVARIGDAVSGGVITGGSTKVFSS